MGGNQSKTNPEELPGGSLHQTSLKYVSTHRVDSANRVFGACYKGNTVVIVNPGRSLVKPYIRVPEGTYAIVQNQGRDVEYKDKIGNSSPVWPPGFHWASLFTKVEHLVTKQYIVFDTPVKGCKTADDVTVHIDMCLILRIMGDESKGEDPILLRRFVYELGPRGLEVQLRAAQDEAVRALARSIQHTEVYSLRDGVMKERYKTGGIEWYTTNGNADELGTPRSASNEDVTCDVEGSEVPDAPVLYCVTEDIRRSLNEQFNYYGVEITSVSITNVSLPADFQAQMESRTTHLSAIKEQNMKQMSDMQLLQYKEEIDMTKLKRNMIWMEVEQTGKAQCAEIQKEIDLIVADTELVKKTIQQETKVQCNNIDVDASLKIAEIQAEMERIATEIDTHAAAEIQVLNAEKQGLDIELKARIQEIDAIGKAKAAEIIAKAEGVAAQKLEKFRAHELSMQRLNVISNLTKNKQTVISGDTANSLLSEMLVANRQNNIMVNVDGSSVIGQGSSGIRTRNN